MADTKRPEGTLLHGMDIYCCSVCGAIFESVIEMEECLTCGGRLECVEEGEEREEEDDTQQG